MLEALAKARRLDPASARTAIADLTATFPGKYPGSHLRRFDSLRDNVASSLAHLGPEALESWTDLANAVAEFEAHQREALLANPLLDFEQLLVIKRVPLSGARRTSWEGFGYGEFLGIPRQSSWNYGTMPNVNKWTNEITRAVTGPP